MTTGGGTNYLCLPETPEYNKYYSGGGSAGSIISGTEYSTYQYGVFPDSAEAKNVPCARCHSGDRSSMAMIPAKRSCPDEWTKEYEGRKIIQGRVRGDNI